LPFCPGPIYEGVAYNFIVNKEIILKTFSLLGLGVILSIAGAKAQVGELDPQIVPQEIIVRVDAHGNHEIFKVAISNDVKNDQNAAAAVAAYVKNENKIESVIAESELDKETSVDSWYFYYNPYYSYGYNFGYSYYGNNYYYRPYYNYNYGYYNYYYYRYY
jgi:hypothetical protein